MKLHTTPRPRAGFTLLEVLLAMGVLLLGVSMLLGLLTFGAALSRAALLRGKASATVEAVIQDLEENLFTLTENGTAGAPSPILERPVPGAPGVFYSAEAEPLLASPVDDVGGELLHREYLVTVDVRWEAGGVQRKRAWRTVLLREVPFGERMRRRFLETEAPPRAAALNDLQGGARSSAPTGQLGARRSAPTDGAARRQTEQSP